MGLLLDQLFVYRKVAPESVLEFVEFWSELYDYGNDEPYQRNINGPHTPEGLLELFRWKIGDRFFEAKKHILKRCFISRRKDAQRLVRDLPRTGLREFAERFLVDHFKGGGAIWRIFWLHCWDNRFPIYDQHVHRAMTYIEDKKPEELSGFLDKKKIRLYLDRYLPFFEHFKGIDSRMVDRALWQFGKSLPRAKKPKV
jgi:hypothetical protein